MVLHWFKIPLEVQYTITSYKALLGMQHVVSLTLIFQKRIVLLSVTLSRYLMLYAVSFLMEKSYVGRFGFSSFIVFVM